MTVCIGGGSVPNVDAATVLAAFDVSGPFWLTDAEYLSFVSNPPGESGWAGRCTAVDTVGPYGYCGYALACTKARSLLFCEQTPGDVAQTSALAQAAAIKSGSTLTSRINDAAKAAGTTVALVTSALIANGTITATAAAPFTLGISLAIEGVSLLIGAIYQHHIEAVKAQANMLGQACPAATTAIALIDAAVAIGAETETNALAGLQSILAAFQSATASLTKTCNAFCFFQGCISSIIASSQAVWSSVGFIAESPATITSAPIANGINEEATPETAAAANSPSTSTTFFGISFNATSIALILASLGIGATIWYGQRKVA